MNNNHSRFFIEPGQVQVTPPTEKADKMPYKIHKTSGGKFKIQRGATAHPPEAKADPNPENHSAMSMFSLKKSPSGKYQVSRNRKLETMSGPPNEKRNKDGKWEKTSTKIHN